MKQLHLDSIVNIPSEITSEFQTSHQHRLISLLPTLLQEVEAHFGIISDSEFRMVTVHFRLDAMMIA